MKAKIVSVAVAAMGILIMSGCEAKKVQIKAYDDNKTTPEVITIPEPGPNPDPIIIIEPEPDIDINETDIAMQKVETIHFAFDSYELDDENYEKVVKNSEIIKGILKKSPQKIRVSGHCDEWGGDLYNIALGQQRVTAVMKVMLEKGVTKSALAPVSFGSMSPVCEESTKECWAKNRRVQFERIYSQDDH